MKDFFPECVTKGSRFTLKVWGWSRIRSTLSLCSPFASDRKWGPMAMPMAIAAKVVAFGGFKRRVTSFRLAGVALLSGILSGIYSDILLYLAFFLACVRVRVCRGMTLRFWSEIARIELPLAVRSGPVDAHSDDELEEEGRKDGRKGHAFH